MYRRIGVALLGAGAVLLTMGSAALASPAPLVAGLAAPPTAQPGPNSGPPALVAPPFAAGQAVSVESASAPMTLLCDRTPALDAAVAANPPSSPAAARALCIQKGAPLPASTFTAAARFRHRHRISTRFHEAATSLCGNAGCAYIWLFNDANGFGEAEYQADPYGPYAVDGGTLYFGRYTKANGKTSAWRDNAIHNCGPLAFCGYHYIYPIEGLPNGSWVEISGSGTVDLGPKLATWGPVATWNYITWH